MAQSVRTSSSKEHSRVARKKFLTPFFGGLSPAETDLGGSFVFGRGIGFDGDLRTSTVMLGSEDQ